MKKADLKLHELPDTYAADSKYCSLSRTPDIDIGLFCWDEEDEEDDDFNEDDFRIEDLTDYLAGIDDDTGLPSWFKIKTESLLNALSQLKDDTECKIVYCLWHDGCRQDEYLLNPVAHNAEWTYFELGECIY